MNWLWYLSRTAPTLPVGSCPAHSLLTRCLVDHRGLWPLQHNSLRSCCVWRRWHPRAKVRHEILTKIRGGQLKRYLSVLSRISYVCHTNGCAGSPWTPAAQEGLWPPLAVGPSAVTGTLPAQSSRTCLPQHGNLPSPSSSEEYSLQQYLTSLKMFCFAPSCSDPCQSEAPPHFSPLSPLPDCHRTQCCSTVCLTWEEVSFPITR